MAQFRPIWSRCYLAFDLMSFGLHSVEPNYSRHNCTIEIARKLFCLTADISNVSDINQIGKEFIEFFSEEIVYTKFPFFVCNKRLQKDRKVLVLFCLNKAQRAVVVVQLTELLLSLLEVCSLNYVITKF